MEELSRRVDCDSESCNQGGCRCNRHPCLFLMPVNSAGIFLVCKPEIPIGVIDLLLDRTGNFHIAL